MGQVLIQACGNSCQWRRNWVGECGVGIAEAHNNSVKSGVSTRVESDSGIGCLVTQLLSGIGRCFAVDLWTWKSRHLDAGFLYVLVPCVCMGRPSSTVVPCVCLSEAVWPVNDGVWWHGAELWPATICNKGLVKIVKIVPLCEGSNTGEHAWTAREASDDDLFCRCRPCGMSVDASVTYWCDSLYQLAPIIWYSKRQNTVESSTFGSDLLSWRLRYKLRMMDVLLEDPCTVFCD